MCKEHQENVSEETKTMNEENTLGYESIIPKEELEALGEIKKAIDKFVDIHNECVRTDEKVKSGGDSPYARIQYIKYSVIMDDFLTSFSILNNTEMMDKEFLDKMAKKMNTDIVGLENKVMLDALLDKVKMPDLDDLED